MTRLLRYKKYIIYIMILREKGNIIMKMKASFRPYEERNKQI